MIKRRCTGRGCWSRRSEMQVSEAPDRTDSDTHSDGVLPRMPASMQDLLVEIDLVRVCLLSHSLTLAAWASSPRATLLTVGRRAGRRIDRRRYANLLGLKCRLVCLKNNFSILFGICWVDHEVVVVASSHYVLCVSREDDLEFVEDTVILVRITQSRS